MVVTGVREPRIRLHHLCPQLGIHHLTPMKRRLLHGKLRDIGLGKVPSDYRMKLPKRKR